MAARPNTAKLQDTAPAGKATLAGFCSPRQLVTKGTMKHSLAGLTEPLPRGVLPLLAIAIVGGDLANIATTPCSPCLRLLAWP